MNKQNGIYANAVKVWLAIGLFMVFIQIFLGGVTRLTGSGLSITKWDIVTGTIPPLDEVQWNETFDLYKKTPQYKKINNGMSLADFKFIFFWEYTHRLWGRLMGFVFLIPFIVFKGKGLIDPPLAKRLIIVVLMAAIVASLGWIMVASGLTRRPWVNAYKLAIHLSAALILFSYLFWTFLKVSLPHKRVINNHRLKSWITLFFVLLITQLFLGGMMSGMKAGVYFPTWPDMNGSFIPDIIKNGEQWTTQNFIFYDQTPFMSGLVQFLHRFTAYSLIITGLYLFLMAKKITVSLFFSRSNWLFISAILIQVILGILTVIHSKGAIPLWLGVFHQAGALLLLTSFLLMKYQVRKY